MIVAKAGLMHTPWVGAVIVILALLLTRFSGQLDKRQRNQKVDANNPLTLN